VIDLAPLAALAVVPVPEPTGQAMAYYRVTTALWAFGLVWAIALPSLILFSGWSARIRDRASRMFTRPVLRLAAYLVLYGLVTFALELPLGYYGEFVVEHDFGLSNQSFSKWLGDALIGFGVGTVITFVIALGVYRMLRRSPERWWLWLGIASVPFVCFMFLVTPIWINPLFNKFGPMKDHALESRILDLAARAGIEGGKVFEVEKSVDTKKISAYVTGFLDTKRIVLWDTLVGRLSEPEVMFVMGHEMGHYVLGHVWKTILALCALIMLALYAAHRLSRGLIARYGARFGFTRLDDIASWPLVNAVAAVVFVVTLPLFNAYVRYHEHEADQFGLEITRNSDAAANAFVKLQSDNLANPRPGLVVHLLRDNHPTLAERIEFANTYRPWEQGKPLEYGGYFRK